MIVYHAVCDNCGTMEEVKEENPHVVIKFSIMSSEDYVAGKRFANKDEVVSFCSQGCIGDWFSKNVNVSEVKIELERQE